MHQEPQKADVIVGFGNFNTDIAARAAELYLQGYAPKVLFTGGLGRNTEGMLPEPEAVRFAKVAMECGVPEADIILEDKSRNTKENIEFTRTLLEEMGIPIPFKHVSNSPAIVLHPQVQLDGVRAGDILYGLNPVDDDLWEKEDFKQVMHWYTQVAMVKEVPAGTQVGYGGTYTTQRPTKIATIPIGFADGYNRKLSNKGKVRIHDMDAPIIGRVCMDQFMVDVTDIPNVQRGDTVALLDDHVSILWMANLLDVNVDEIVCGISKRVPRVYEG